MAVVPIYTIESSYLYTCNFNICCNLHWNIITWYRFKMYYNIKKVSYYDKNVYKTETRKKSIPNLFLLS